MHNINKRSYMQDAPLDSKHAVKKGQKRAYKGIVYKK